MFNPVFVRKKAQIAVRTVTEALIEIVKIAFKTVTKALIKIVAKLRHFMTKWSRIE